MVNWWGSEKTGEGHIGVWCSHWKLCFLDGSWKFWLALPSPTFRELLSGQNLRKLLFYSSRGLAGNKVSLWKFDNSRIKQVFREKNVILALEDWFDLSLSEVVNELWSCLEDMALFNKDVLSCRWMFTKHDALFSRNPFLISWYKKI